MSGPLPDHVVNTDFSYPVWSDMPFKGWTAIDRNTRRWFNGDWGDSTWQPLPASFDSDAFGWDSTQQTSTTNPDGEQQANAVELQKDTDSNNVYAELTAAQTNTGIYQDISTVPGTEYRWHIQHASMNRDHLDSMSVMIGAPGQESAQEATRVSTNGNGDPLGPVGTVISTTVSNDDHFKHEEQWETYSGAYRVPAGQTTTRFTFKAISSPTEVNGNDLDNIVFDISYPLNYDMNGGVGKVSGNGIDSSEGTTLPDGTTSGCQVSYLDGTAVTLATAAKGDDCWDSSQIASPGGTFLGWTDQRIADVTDDAEWQAAKPHIVTKATVTTRGVTVYALWGRDKTYTFNPNPPAGHSAPPLDTTQVVHFGQGAVSPEHWTPGDTSLVPGYKFVGWSQSPDNHSIVDIVNTPATSDQVLYAQWSAESASLTYDANGGVGSVAQQTATTDESVKVSSADAMSLPGHLFKGWNTKPDGSGVDYKPGEMLPLPAGGTTLYAQWDAAQSTLPVTGTSAVVLAIAATVAALAALILLCSIPIYRRRK